MVGIMVFLSISLLIGMLARKYNIWMDTPFAISSY